MVMSRTVIAVPPGATIKDQLIDRGMTQKEFASRMNLSEKHISKLINGEVRLTPDVAFRLEMVLGIPAQFWNKLEAIYQEKLIKATAENEMDEDISFSKRFPYNEMSKNGWLPKTNKPQERVIYLRQFFEVANLSLIRKPLIPGIACRQLSETQKSDYSLIAWAQKAKLEARSISTAAINLQALQDALTRIRGMTILSPEQFCPQLCQLLSECGIAIVFLPHIGGSFLHGATFIDGNKIVLGLTVRGKDADRFWFSLFHELGHILLGHIGQVDGTTKEDEDAADEFAKHSLIPPSLFCAFVDARDFSKASIVNFSQRIGIASGIVVGRLQKESYIEYNWHNDLKVKYVISDK